MGGHGGGGGRSGRGGGGAGGAEPVIKTPGDGVVSPFSDIYGENNMSDRYTVEGNVDYTKPVGIRVTGNTFNNKSQLKDEGYSWNPSDKSWTKIIPGSKSKFDLSSAIREAARYANRRDNLHFQVSN